MIWILTILWRLRSTLVFLVPYFIFASLFALSYKNDTPWLITASVLFSLLYTVFGWRQCVNPECLRRRVKLLPNGDPFGRITGECSYCRGRRIWFTVASRAKPTHIGEPMNPWRMVIFLLGVVLSLFAKGF